MLVLDLLIEIGDSNVLLNNKNKMIKCLKIKDKEIIV